METILDGTVTIKDKIYLILSMLIDLTSNLKIRWKDGRKELQDMTTINYYTYIGKSCISLSKYDHEKAVNLYISIPRYFGYTLYFDEKLVDPEQLELFQELLLTILLTTPGSQKLKHKCLDKFMNILEKL